MRREFIRFGISLVAATLIALVVTVVLALVVAILDTGTIDSTQLIFFVLTLATVLYVIDYLSGE